ncbi:polyhydroxyalkanoate synthesis regulator DNA-binding domain-containing protein [Rappaport israeli]|uniref:polyhydroxyalkanoate synthesis regulator DNA-binding domain-containing protein n=1 Tax=Rappaport israeli TaxID=1839807 RepID=UPI000930748F|nr:polyhydroxyalkanoate synthesis regulator DNA-binding domain-containing protein [Rappaport israeli]
MSQARLIKKYPNRRLYDTSASCYVSNDDIKALIRAGEQINIIDSKTGEDLTRYVLLTIIAEGELSGATPIFTQKTLADIARFDEAYLAGILGIYLEQAVDFFIAHQEVFYKQMRDFSGDDPLITIAKLIQAQIDCLENSN